MSILVAGSNTASYTLAMAVFYILRNPKIRKRLVRELDEHVPDPDQMPPLPELEMISYLVSFALHPALAHGRFWWKVD